MNICTRKNNYIQIKVLIITAKIHRLCAVFRDPERSVYIPNPIPSQGYNIHGINVSASVASFR